MFGAGVGRVSRLWQVCVLAKRHAGHSKWANIRHIKASKDGQRSLLFTKLCRQMKVAIQEGGSANPSLNLRLTHVIEQAKRANMPMATIQGVLKNGAQRKDECKAAIIEIKGPGGLILLCEVFTANYNRCKMDIAIVLKKYSASFSDGGGRHLFERRGVVEATTLGATLDQATEHAIEAGAEEVRLVAGNQFQFTCGPEHVAAVHGALEALRYQVTSARVTFVPVVCVQLAASELDKMAALCARLQRCEDVVHVYDNIG